METAVVKSNSSVKLPENLVKKYGIRKGTKIFFVEEKDHMKIFPITEIVIDKNTGFLGTKGKLLKALKQEKNREMKL